MTICNQNRVSCASLGAVIDNCTNGALVCDDAQQPNRSLDILEELYVLGNCENNDAESGGPPKRRKRQNQHAGLRLKSVYFM